MSQFDSDRDLSRLIALPFQRDEVESPASEGALVLGGPGSLTLPDEIGRSSTTVVQGFRPAFNAWVSRNFTTIPEISRLDKEDRFGIVIVCLSRHRRWNEIMLADAAKRCAEGGVVIAAGSKSDGAGAIRKMLSEMLESELSSLPKHHGMVMWFRVDEQARVALKAMGERPPTRASEKFVTAPGGFSANRIDDGSLLLVEHLPLDLSGSLADFCAGWGYLAVEAAKRCEGLSSLDLFEADWSSLEAARSNLRSADRPAEFHWLDLANERVEGRFDVIVMNPPFHIGRAAEPAIGATLIERASSALKPSGQLFLVANRQLPYETVLDRFFARNSILAETKSYKVFQASAQASAHRR
ncbi:class I SAM-dependent methyltransferase [Notoacmeibacter ruber]|uniref:Class I SAM-dependent methyltransferase n=1 Tax=Notoacmeibacter ruber TaxID=2670375 RepID=A0A3L7J8R0_9HYPH|nr:class I SAM-dependent methyltransferase [Notoacmeibacter ruber]RLQ87006.1 class I SAM-dependent methyltransferase [Notoacmeibacter ruber]